MSAESTSDRRHVPSAQTVRGLIRRVLAPVAPPLTPELRCWAAAEFLPIWTETETAFEAEGLAPPFWAFAWPGGQALARTILDAPHLVAGRSVLALGAGAGLEAIAAAASGATRVVANDLDPAAAVAVEMNTALTVEALDQASGWPSRLTTETRNRITGTEPLDDAFDVILAGDVFYTRALATEAWPKLRAAARRGATVLLGDPDRAYLPRDALNRIAVHDVATPRDLEDQDVVRTGVWTPRHGV